MINLFYKFIFPIIVFIYVISNSLYENEINWWPIGLILLWFISIIYDWIKSPVFISFKKSVNIKRVTNNYLKCSHQTSFSSEIIEKKKQAIQVILNFAINEPLNQIIIKKHNINYKKIEEMLDILERIGCGQIVKGHYVSISALMFPQTLDFIFSQNMNGRENLEQVAFELVEWFAKGHSHELVR
jgi:hypothetical protein